MRVSFPTTRGLTPTIEPSTLYRLLSRRRRSQQHPTCKPGVLTSLFGLSQRVTLMEISSWLTSSCSDSVDQGRSISISLLPVLNSTSMPTLQHKNIQYFSFVATALSSPSTVLYFFSTEPLASKVYEIGSSFSSENLQHYAFLSSCEIPCFPARYNKKIILTPHDSSLATSWLSTSWVLSHIDMPTQLL